MRSKFYLSLVLLSWTVIATAQNYTVAEPRMRVNKSSSLSLTTSWQTLNFNGTSTNNFNTYGTDPSTGNKMIWYDTANNLFKFYGEYDKNINMQIFVKTTTTLITTPATLQYRCVIPNGISAGVDLYFPFPDDGGYGEIAGLTTVTSGINLSIEPLNVYINSNIRTNGFYIQVKLSNALITLGTSTVNSAAVVISSRN